MKKSFGTTKQVGVEVELQKPSLSDVVADTQETSKTIDEELEMEQMTPEHVLRRLSITVLDRYSSSLLLTDEEKPEYFNETLPLKDTTKAEFVEIAKTGKKMTWMIQIVRVSYSW